MTDIRFGPATGSWSGKQVHAPVRSHWQSIVIPGPCGKPDCEDCPSMDDIGAALYHQIPGWLFDRMCYEWAREHSYEMSGSRA